ncbi:hypothetical protein [Halalkalicoccus ordinarius]|uniref:hypothetical protein n=1 Tax=Halalkalicoccus ordinarius TaxID=3116651 RepID=UPI00300F146A
MIEQAAFEITPLLLILVLGLLGPSFHEKWRRVVSVYEDHFREEYITYTLYTYDRYVIVYSIMVTGIYGIIHTLILGWEAVGGVPLYIYFIIGVFWIGIIGGSYQFQDDWFPLDEDSEKNPETYRSYYYEKNESNNLHNIYSNPIVKRIPLLKRWDSLFYPRNYLVFLDLILITFILYFKYLSRTTI